MTQLNQDRLKIILLLILGGISLLGQGCSGNTAADPNDTGDSGEEGTGAGDPEKEVKREVTGPRGRPRRASACSAC